MEAPVPTPDEQKMTLDLELNNKKYSLGINSGKESMTMKLSPLEEECLCYTRNLTLKELKEMSQFFAEL